MADLRLYNRKFITDFINLYKSLPELWKIKSKDYSDRKKKNDAYEKMVNKMKEIDSEATKDTVKKKINSLRSSYRKELRKVEASTRSGAGTEDIYEPSLWYYSLLDFLRDHETPGPSQSNFNDMESTSLKFEENGSECEVLLSHDDDNEEIPAKPKSSRHSRPAKRKSVSSVSTDLSDEVLQNIHVHFKRPLLHDDKFDVFGKNVAMKLRDLPNDQRLIAEKIINDTLYKAELGQLTFSHQRRPLIHVTTSPSPPTHQPQLLIPENPLN